MGFFNFKFISINVDGWRVNLFDKGFEVVVVDVFFWNKIGLSKIEFSVVFWVNIFVII